MLAYNDLNLVEVAGVEPACPDLLTTASTCLVHLFNLKNN